MTFAYVKDNKVVMISSANVVEWNGVVIQGIRLLSPTERRERGIFDFIPAGVTPPYHRAGGTTHTINGGTGTVTEVVEAIPLPLDEVKAAKLTELAQLRYQVETGGVVVNGTQIKTDRESQTTITGAWVRVQQNPTTLIDWKGADSWVQINKAAVEGIAEAVGTHVQACFTAEKLHSDAINALGTVNSVVAYDITTGWPQNGL